MTPEKPATGILKTNEWGDSKWYKISCDCGSPECEHNVEVEADDINVQVHIYATVHTKWWKKNRFAQIWEILTKGYAEMETTILMDDQTALNYAETLKTALHDVKEFRMERKKK